MDRTHNLFILDGMIRPLDDHTSTIARAHQDIFHIKAVIIIIAFVM